MPDLMRQHDFGGWRSLFLSAALLIVSGCSDPAAPDLPQSIRINPLTAELASGEQLQLSATVMGTSGTPLEGRVVQWAIVGTDTLGTVTAQGLYTAGMNRGTGLRSVEIRAAVDGISASASLSIRPVQAGAILLETDSIILTSGEGRALTARVVDASGVDLPGRPITWVSRDPNIIQIDTEGLVQASLYLTPEVRDVVVVAQSEGQQDSLHVRVNPVPVSRIALPDSLLVLAESDRISIGVRAYDALDRELAARSVEWIPEDSTIIRMIHPDTLEATPYTGDAVRQSRLVARIAEGQQASGGAPVEAEMGVRVFVDYERASTFFELMPGAFPDLQDYVDWFGPGWDPIHSGAVSMTNIQAMDLTQDGHIDLLIHPWKPVGQPIPGIDVYDPVRNRLIAFLNDGTGRFRDGTAELFGQEIVDMGGAMSRNHVVGDFNGDGIPDVAFALNREDGRHCLRADERGCLTWKAVGHAMMSQGPGRYTLIPFGEPAWHHSIGKVRQNGRDVILTQWENFAYAGGSFREIPNMPQMGNGDMVGIGLTPSGDSEYLVTDRDNRKYWGQAPGLRLFRRMLGTWVQLDEWVFPNARNLWTYTESMGEDNRWWKAVLVEHGGKEFIRGAFEQICTIEPVPGRGPIVIAQYSAHRILQPTMGADTIPYPAIHNSALLLAFGIEGRLVELPGVFGPDAQIDVNANFTHCRDLNGDGFPDVVHYAYAQGWLGKDERPIVFLNDGTGNFRRVPENRFPLAPWMGPQWSSLLMDVDGDGIEDLLYFPGNGCNAEQGCGLVLFRGRRPLQ